MQLQQRREPSREAGFSLLELSVALFITLISIAVLVPLCVRTLSMQQLISTRELLVDNLRLTQELGQTAGTFGAVRLAKYAPTYGTYVGGRQLSAVHFAPGVNYVDGYLQMPTGALTYDQLGNCQVSGVIRLTDGRTELDIDVYMGVGLQALGS